MVNQITQATVLPTFQLSLFRRRLSVFREDPRQQMARSQVHTMRACAFSAVLCSGYINANNPQFAVVTIIYKQNVIIIRLYRPPS